MSNNFWDTAMKKRYGTVLLPLVVAGVMQANSEDAYAASPGCIAANGTVSAGTVSATNPDGDTSSISPLSNPIAWAQFADGETVTVVVTTTAVTVDENESGRTLYWDSGEDRPYFGITDNEIFSGVTSIGLSQTFTFTVTPEARGTADRLVLEFSYGDIAVSCISPGSDNSALEMIQMSGTLIASQQSAATTVSSVRSQISSRLKSCSAANDTPYTKDAAVASCPLDTASVDVWGSLTHTGFTGDGDADHKQVNAYAGVDGFLTNNLVGGVFVGYEYSNTEFDSLNGELDGNGQSVGAYMGYTFSDVVKFDAGISQSWLSYDVSDSAASAEFDAQRTLAFAGLSGAISVGGLLIEPTADLLAVWQDEESYSDSLDADHHSRSFTAIRASAGTRFSFTDVGTENWAVMPYAGLYGDYWSTDDDAGSSADYASVLEDFSGRVNGGLNFESRTHGIALDLNAEYSGIGDVGALSGRAGLTLGF